MYGNSGGVGEKEHPKMVWSHLKGRITDFVRIGVSEEL